jgi:hypothetical protein
MRQNGREYILGKPCWLAKHARPRNLCGIRLIAAAQASLAARASAINAVVKYMSPRPRTGPVYEKQRAARRMLSCGNIRVAARLHAMQRQHGP